MIDTKRSRADQQLPTWLNTTRKILFREQNWLNKQKGKLINQADMISLFFISFKE